MSEVFIVYLSLKKNRTHIEILKIFYSKEEAYKFKNEYNTNRPFYSLASVKAFKIEEPSDIWYQVSKDEIENERQLTKLKELF